MCILAIIGESLMKIWQTIKTVLYTVAGILILVFNEQIMPAVGFVVGTTITVYGVDLLILTLLRKKFFGENALVFDALIYILIGIIIFIVSGDIVKVCLVWAVWSILRESKEMNEAMHRISHGRPSFINLAESVVCIVLCFLMVLEPTLHHAHTHIIILGIELILEVAFPIFNRIIDDSIENRKAKANQHSDGE